MFILPTIKILIIAAVLPAALLLVYIYKKDRLEKEPAGLLVKLVLWGIFTTALAMLTESLGISYIETIAEPDSTKYNLLLYFGVVALSEEGFKYVILKWKTWNHPAFNCQFDGVVYAVFVSLGFALWENISYVISYGFTAAIARAITAVPGHACFGVFMGVFYGIAKKYDLAGLHQESRYFRVLALIVPLVLHGLYDYIVSCVTSLSWLFDVFVLLLFFVSYKLVKKTSESDRFMTGASQTY